jgi:hypothetical protein
MFIHGFIASQENDFSFPKELELFSGHCMKFTEYHWNRAIRGES